MKIPDIKIVGNNIPLIESPSNTEIRGEEEIAPIVPPREVHSSKGAITSASYATQLQRNFNYMWELVKGRVASKWTAASAVAFLLLIISLRYRSQSGIVWKCVF